MEHIESRSCERPINNGSQFKDERNGEVASENDRTYRIELVNHEAAFSQFGQSNTHLIRAEEEIEAYEDVESNYPAIILECVALIIRISILNIRALRICLYVFFTILDRLCQAEKDKNVGNNEHKTVPVKLNDACARLLRLFRN